MQEKTNTDEEAKKKERPVDTNSEPVRTQRAINQSYFYFGKDDDPTYPTLQSIFNASAPERFLDIRKALFPVNSSELSFAHFGERNKSPNQLLDRPREAPPEYFYANLEEDARDFLPNLFKLIDEIDSQLAVETHTQKSRPLSCYAW